MTDPIDINRAKKRKQNDKISTPDAFQAIADAINEYSRKTLEDFPIKVGLIQLAPGVKRPVIIDRETGICRPSCREEIAEEIMNYTYNVLAGNRHYRFTARQVFACYDYWLTYTRAMESPHLFLWNDGKGYCYQRLPWDEGVLGETPLWNEILGRMNGQHEAFMAWIGSLFFPDSDRQQYLWLYGTGENGKSTIIRMLAKVFGRGFLSTMVPDASNRRFWAASLLRKRVVAFPDTNNASFPASGMGKLLLGNDPFPIEEKGEPMYDAQLECKFVFSSNSRPNISSERADVRRAIMIPMEPIPCKASMDYEKVLWKETGYFLSRCLALFDLAYPDHGRINFEDDSLNDHISTLEEKFDVFFHKRFVVPEYDNSTLVRSMDYVTPSAMTEELDLAFRSNQEKSECREYMERKYGVRRRNVRQEDGSFISCYPGIRLRDHVRS